MTPAHRRPAVLLIPLVLGTAAFAGALTARRPAAASPTLAPGRFTEAELDDLTEFLLSL
jgi:hypothetical protein